MTAISRPRIRFLTVISSCVLSFLSAQLASANPLLKENILEITDTGDLNQILSQQSPLVAGHSIDVDLLGQDNLADLTQWGTSNLIQGSVAGIENQAIVHQAGSTNRAIFRQQGQNNFISITQGHR
ncbi:curlin repeat-containing protein [Sulfitobacter sp. R18_1]|uniref:curlin repeat-containing protein n=1 Tax=Sulfitobacter sp. R18_1 TaxID=2821104 RepID=UPI001ADAF30C|nr:curlin repeat-containing protein [Sulfitobacter sp. R18_1]MBO9428704.1 curlin repeat-containing protein [Sulfitobacter sp. R18_1]